MTDMISIPKEVDIECAIGGAYERAGQPVWIDGPIAREAARRVMAMLAEGHKDWSDPDSIESATIDEIRAEISRQIDWYEAKGREMKTREYQLALAVVIGATVALTDLREKLAALTTPTGAPK